MLTAIDVTTGLSRWTISTLGGRLLAVSATKVYLESHDDDLFVVDRQTGKIIYDPATTFQRAGINLRGFALGPTNRFDDRLYFGTTHGLVVCLREIGQVAPRPLRDPKAKPFGYIPPEGYPDTVRPRRAPVAPPPTETDRPEVRRRPDPACTGRRRSSSRTRGPTQVGPFRCRSRSGGAKIPPGCPFSPDPRGGRGSAGLA